MKTLSKLVGLGLLVLALNSCNVLTFSGKTNVEINNDIVFQTVTWDTYSSNKEIENKFYTFVNETLKKNRFTDYEVLYASNFTSDLGERSYVYKIFKTPQDKQKFLNRADDIIQLTTSLASNSFRDRWDQLQWGMNAGEVYDLLPELADFGAQQEMYVDKSRLTLSDYWLDFDFRGILSGFGRGNADFNNSSPKRNEDWVF